MKKGLNTELLVAVGLAIVLTAAAVVVNQGQKPETIRQKAITGSQEIQTGRAEEITDSQQASASRNFSLRVGTPYNGQVVKTATVKVSGITMPGADVAINDKETRADGEGKFSYNLTLDEGDNMIDVVANDSFGNWAEKEITVTYEAE